MSEPYVGQSATWSPFTDKYPCTVVEVSKSKKTVKVQEDESRWISGSAMDGSAKYEIVRDLNGPIMEFSLRKNGRWVRVGAPAKSGARLFLGVARRYVDPHF